MASRQVFRARWVLPISEPPIHDGWVAIEAGRIQSVGPTFRSGVSDSGNIHDSGNVRDLGDVAILPGLVNAHTHLELSYLHERIPSTKGFGVWVREVMHTRRQYPDTSDPRILEPARQAVADARAAGTALFGDISNTLATVRLLRDAGMPAQVFHELTGFTEQNPDARVQEARARADTLGGSGDVRVSVAPHAPYSVSAALFKAIRADLDRHPNAVSSVHLGETPEEVELLRAGTGEIRTVLEELGRWPDDWRAPGVGPVEYLATLGVLDPRMLVVHGVQFSDEDLDRLRVLGSTVVSCPRSNVHVGVGAPPLQRFYDSAVPVAFGTDSLASVGDLNVFSELAEARRLAPAVPARRLLESATKIGARALGFGDDFGTIEPGKRAALIAVQVPADTTDVEEYLVSGILPRSIRVLEFGV